MARSNRQIKIGCCGFRASRQSYYSLLNAVEVQHTFYQPPQLATLERWRREAPEEFEFSLKAWQLITHQASSPTYRRLKRKLTEEEEAASGSFRPTALVQEAWEATRASAKALGASAVVFQCPASFRPTNENIAHLLNFFGTMERGGLTFCWEPRGGWPREVIKELCDHLNLWHVVDPFAERTVTPEKCYFRLHGRGSWRYSYEDAELEELLLMLPQDGLAYVFFNNIEMKNDALRFQKIVEEGD